MGWAGRLGGAETPPRRPPSSPEYIKQSREPTRDSLREVAGWAGRHGRIHRPPSGSIRTLRRQPPRSFDVSIEPRLCTEGDWRYTETLRTCLEEDECMKAAVLESLRDSSWVHIACSFELFGNERLKLLNIVENRLPNPEFAFLSGCHSAEQTLDSALDEVLHAAAMQFCILRSIVVTMWEVNDDNGPFIVESFYKQMFLEKKDTHERGLRRSARALQKSVWHLRATGIPMERWVNLIHIGA